MLGNEAAIFGILVVDDHEPNRYTLRTLLTRHLPARVYEAASGAQALELALAQPTAIDLVILDVQMPDLDGFETATLFRARHKLRDIPIVFLTAAFKAEEFQQRGYALGAADYLLKPIEDNQLINKIGAYLRLILKERQLNQKLELKVQERTAALAQTQEYLEKIIAYMGEALLVLNPQGVITRANPAAYQMLSYASGQLLGRSIGDVFEEEDPEQAEAFFGTWLEGLIRSGVIPNVEASFIARDGRRVPVLFSRSALKDTSGSLTDIICIAKDMSNYHKAAPRALRAHAEESPYERN